MRRLAIVFAVLATFHMAEVAVTPQRAMALETAVERVVNLAPLVLGVFPKVPLAVSGR